MKSTKGRKKKTERAIRRLRQRSMKVRIMAQRIDSNSGGEELFHSTYSILKTEPVEPPNKLYMRCETKRGIKEDIILWPINWKMDDKVK